MIEVNTTDIYFTVKLPPISKKNSQQIFNNPKSGKPFIMPSKKYKEYEKAALWFIPKGERIDFSVNVKCLFYMPTRRKCDLTNLLEAIDDVMVKAGLLADDNFTIIQSHDGSRVLYDKEHPRTEVYITRAGKEKEQPAADVAEVRHGHWIEDNEFFRCSECGCLTDYRLSKFCPDCGAKMDGKVGAE